MKLSLDILKSHNACVNGIAWYQKQNGLDSVEKTIVALFASEESEKYNWSNWLLSPQGPQETPHGPQGPPHIIKH